MKRLSLLIAVWMAGWLPCRCFAQDQVTPYTGPVTVRTFAPTVYSIDSSANAVILFDIGVVNFDPAANNGRGFNYILSRHTRIRILRRNAFGLANLNLSAYRKGPNSPSIEDFNGVTYNLQDGKVVATRLDKTNIFKDRNGDLAQEKVAFPNISEGSVIDYSFTVIYPGFQYIPAWIFQGSYPELWSEYDITVPTLYDYAVRHQGYQKYAIDSAIYADASFPVDIGGFSGTWNGRTIRRIWALRDVPALEKPEPYTTTLRNHLSQIGFQLSAVHMNGFDRTYRTTWGELVDELLKRTGFGGTLNDRNRWMDDALSKITHGAGTKPERLRKIFAAVRDQIGCNGAEGLYLSQPLKKIWDEKKGNVADVNLLLIAFCRHEGMDASPVILSSRQHGYAVDDYPLLSDYNYVVSRVRLGDSSWLLDASRPYIGFGQLPGLCYNGWARVIDSSAAQIPLFPDSVWERRVTSVRLANTDSGYVGDYHRLDGVFESMEVRNRLRNSTMDDFFSSLRKTMAEDKEMWDYGFDSLADPDARLGWHYRMKYDFTQGRVYFNPIFHERFNSNPFRAAVRHYPVEMPFCIDNRYILEMGIPKGYTVDQLPASTRVPLGDSAGVFEYEATGDQRLIRIRVTLIIRKTNFGLEEYAGIRDFFGRIVSKESEPVILKKMSR